MLIDKRVEGPHILCRSHSGPERLEASASEEGRLIRCVPEFYHESPLLQEPRLCSTDILGELNVVFSGGD